MQVVSSWVTERAAAGTTPPQLCPYQTVVAIEPMCWGTRKCFQGFEDLLPLLVEFDHFQQDKDDTKHHTQLQNDSRRSGYVVQERHHAGLSLGCPTLPCSASFLQFLQQSWPIAADARSG